MLPLGCVSNLSYHLDNALIFLTLTSIFELDRLPVLIIVTSNDPAILGALRHSWEPIPRAFDITSLHELCLQHDLDSKVSTMFTNLLLN